MTQEGCCFPDLLASVWELIPFNAQCITNPVTFVTNLMSLFFPTDARLAEKTRALQLSCGSIAVGELHMLIDLQSPVCENKSYRQAAGAWKWYDHGNNVGP